MQLRGGAAGKHALVIGINAYRNGIPALSSAVHDARAIAEVLERDQGYHVTLLIDAEASLAGIRAALAAVVGAAGSRDRVIFYFAGHGIAEDAGAGDDGPRGYFIPQDADKSRTDSFLAMDEVRGVLAQSHVHHLLLLLDCCFAGSFQWSSTRDLRVRKHKLYKERYDRYVREPAWQAIASSACDERALDVVAGKVLGERASEHSPFAAACIEGLRGAADLGVGGRSGDGVVIAGELYLFLEEAFFRHEQITGRRQQTPSLWSFGGPKRAKGQFIFELRGADPSRLPSALELNEANNPYRGLSPYGESTAGLFFGREAATRALLEAVQRQVITVVVGASGTGKSSLVAAGLLPRLRGCAEPSYTILAPQRPESAPLAAIERLVEQLGLPRATSLADAVAAFHAREPGAHLVVIIDQLEELVTQASDAAVRASFLSALADAAERGAGWLHVVMTLRLDFEAHFSELLATRPDGAPRFLIPHLSREELRQVVEGPATERVLFFEPPELVDVLIDEVIDAPGALPLLSFTLSEMYRVYVQRARDDRTLRREDYESLGGVSGALARRADEVYSRLASNEERTTMRRMLLRMVVPGESARRPVLESELQFADSAENTRVQAVSARLVDARLAASGKDALGRRFIEPAHDKLVTGWPLLQTFIDAERDRLALMHALGQAATQWAAGGRASGLLWDDDPRRPQVLALRRSEPSRFNVLEQEFVERSQQRRKRFWITVITGVSVALVGLSVFAGLAWYQRNEAITAQAETEKQRQTAVTAQGEAERRLADLYSEHGRRHMLEGNHMRALPYLVEVYRARPEDPELRWSIAEAAKVASEYRMFEGHRGEVRHLLFFPDGKRLLTAASEDPRPRIHDVQSGKMVREYDGHAAPIVYAALMTQGVLEESVVTVSEDGQIRAWNPGTGATSVSLSHCEPEVACDLQSAHFVEFGGRLVTATNDEIRVWDVASGSLLGAQSYERGTAASDTSGVQLSPLGDLVVTPGGQLWELKYSNDRVKFREQARLAGEVASPGMFVFNRLSSRVFVDESTFGVDGGPDEWNPEDGTVIAKRRGHMGAVLSASYNEQCTMLITGGADYTARVWDVMGETNQVLYGHSAEVSDARFNADGTRAVTASLDGTVRLWSVEPPGNARGSGHLRPRVGMTLESGSGSGLVSVRFSPAGDRVAAGAKDGTVHVWTTGRQGEPLLLTDNDQAGRERKVRFSGDGERLLVANGLFNEGLAPREQGEDLVGVFDIASRKVSLFLPERVDVLDAAFADAGAAVVTVRCGESDPCTIRRWDSRSGKELGQQTLPVRGSHTAMFSPDGARLAVLNQSDVVLWDVAGGRVVEMEKGELEELGKFVWSPDGAALIGHTSNTAHLWDARTGKLRSTLTGRDFSEWTGTKFAWGPDGVTALVVDGAGLLAWDTRTNTTRPTALGEEVSSIAVAADGSLGLAVGGYRTMLVFDPRGGRALGRLLTEGADTVDVSPDGRWAITRGSWTGQLSLWDLQMETRGPDELAAFSRCHGAFQLEKGELVRSRADASSCEHVAGAASPGGT